MSVYYMVNHISIDKIDKVNHISLCKIYMVNHIVLMYTVNRGGEYVAPSDAQRRASAKYQKEHITTLGCRVKREEATAFKDYCAKLDKTSNTVLKEYVLQCIKGGEHQ